MLTTINYEEVVRDALLCLKTLYIDDTRMLTQKTLSLTSHFTLINMFKYVSVMFFSYVVVVDEGNEEKKLDKLQLTALL
jgi:hypothetical protein